MLQRVMSLFSVEIFRLTVPKNFVGEPFSVSFFPGIEEVRISEWVGGGYQDLPSNFFLSRWRKTSLGNRLVCH